MRTGEPGESPGAKVGRGQGPFVFNTAGDPVQMGLVSSLNRPGGNVTGVANMHMEVAAKRFGILRELLAFIFPQRPSSRAALGAAFDKTLLAAFDKFWQSDACQTL